MPLESGTYISDLVSTNPAITDQVSQGDDHIRLIKKVLLNTFPNINAAVTITDEQLNSLAADLAALQADVDQNEADADAAIAALQTSVNTLETDVNTALTTKANLASPAFTGTPTAPTVDVSDRSTKIATTDYVRDRIEADAYTLPAGTQSTLGGVKIYRSGTTLYINT
jgi:hypothetical protein